MSEVATKYSTLVGKRVEAHYRAADIHLSAVGTLTGDTGKSIFIEERFSQSGKQKTMRVEVPYEYLIRIREVESREMAAATPKPALLPSFARNRR
ncbi:MAG: hypothetical protein ACRD4S_06210 [Candidatus Acidiferrales bacterium]